MFAYGSLAERPASRAELRGYRRRFDVAMDNSVDLPGYKYYVDEASGERPEVFVAFVDLVPDDAAAVNGVVFEVDGDGELERFDRSTDPPEVPVRALKRIDLAVDG